MKTTKILALIMAAAMLVSVFTACSKKEKEETQAPAETVTAKETDPALNHAGDIPDGGAYHKGEEVVGSTAGEIAEFPEIANGDKYYFGDYSYTYSDGTMTNGNAGWIVEVTQKDKESYGVILESVNGAPIVSANGCFKDCTEMKYSPKLPDTVYSMSAAYFGCDTLVQTPIFPASLVDMSNCFSGCMALTMATPLPEGVENMSGAFNTCTNLLNAPEIPASVKNMDSAFYGCFSLKGDVVINANPETYENCFATTMQKFTIKGDTALKAELAATSVVENISY